ncbi:hypothetical protein P3T37_001006 [Kitasatospora sp. MAA4]|uniref:SCO2583 family membrane protein n=1 Tax=Kitasatospora sp. MAA4 TaxID=3035093 RepID=UPI0024768A39|nr:hypothetical protein [Kitasatospora sp. MAA4]MDH6131632.1 hypothetical protein [Kitasatospora sp. MAA4]
MGDPGDPPDGAPEGGSGNDDEYRSVVFDESFVRAARIQELSASERLGGGWTHPVRRRVGLGMLASLPRQALTLLLLIVMAFSAAVYFGISAPQRDAGLSAGTQLTSEFTELVPATAAVPAVDAALPFASLPASAGFADGAAGLGVPTKASTAHFSQAELTQALQTVQGYLEVSELSAQTLTDGATLPVRTMLAPSEQGQFDDSVASPTDDQHHALTGWMVRFDPAKVALASDTVKVAGTVKVAEVNSSLLEITSDDTLVYALRPATAAGTAATGQVSLYTVRREVRMDLDRTDIANGQLRVVNAVVQAGPTACGAAQAGYLQPLPAGSTVASPGQVNPADRSQPAWQQCGVLAPTTTPAG